VRGGDVLAAGVEHSTVVFRGIVEAPAAFSGGAAFPPRPTESSRETWAHALSELVAR
jgi:hypothetical protein